MTMKTAIILLALAGALLTEAVVPTADRTGATDASPALNAALRQLCNGSDPSAAKMHAVVAPPVLTLDLAGGIYRLDTPLTLTAADPPCTGPVLIRDGTLVAGPNFADDRFLIELVDRIGERMVGMTFTMERLVFASNFTGGGLLANRSSFVLVSNCNFINFATYGVWTSGADFRLDRCVLMECTQGMVPCSGPTLKATAMYINGADSHFNRNIVACTHVGFVNADGDNMYHQNHIWTNCQPPQNDTGQGDYNQLGFLVSGGTPQIDGGAIDNTHLVITSYRGAIITNNHFNEASRLILAPPKHPPKKISSQLDRCQYWSGAMCSLRVVGNTFTCGGAEIDSRPSTCGTIETQWVPSQAMQVEIYGNTWENSSAAVCTAKSSCLGQNCSTLFALCDEINHSSCRGDGGGGRRDLEADSSIRQNEAVDWLRATFGISLKGLARLPADDRPAALAEAGLTPLERAQVLSAIDDLLESV